PIPRVPPVTTATRAISAPPCDEPFVMVGRRTRGLSRHPPASSVVSPFDAHRNAHAAADAKRGEALFRVALLHLLEQRDQHPPARGADRMTERDRHAVDG